MATVKIKFRPSIVSSKEGTLSIQIIHNRIARQIGIGYKVFPMSGTGHGQRSSFHPGRMNFDELILRLSKTVSMKMCLPLTILSSGWNCQATDTLPHKL